MLRTIDSSEDFIVECGVMCEQMEGELQLFVFAFEQCIYQTRSIVLALCVQ